MFKEIWQKTVGALVLACPLLLGACASQDDVKRAQATADQALLTAQQANQAAQAADQTAVAANAKADRMFQQALKK
jgi:hypothetical protein